MLKKSALILGLFILLPLCVHAANDQIASLSIDSGQISIMHTPEDFSFDTTFITSSPAGIFKLLDPAIYENQLIVDDSNTEGLNYYVTLTLSNLISQDDIIPYSNISFVTLSDDTSGVDALPPSPPAASVNVTAPLDCPWNGNLVADCDGMLESNYLQGAEQFIATDPTSSVTENTDTIYVSNPSLYTYKEVIELSGGEKALITEIAGGSNSFLKVKRGIMGTTPTSHLAGSGITSYGYDSLQIEIMNGPEPPGGRIGAYSIGFGSKALIDPSFKAGDYTGIITFTLYTY